MEALEKVKNKCCCDLAREQTIKEVLEALKSEEAIDALTRGFGFARPSSVADWLEKRFKGEK